MNQRPTHLFLSLLVLIGLLIVPAHAQSQDPEAIMNASASAIKEVAGFNAQFQMKGQGAAMFADTLPSMTGQLFFGTHDELGRVIHCIGEAKDQQKAPSQAIDILITKDRYLWTDHSKQTINEHPRNRSSRGLPAAFNLVLVQSLINDDPYANDTDGALSMSVLTQETIAGTLCDVVEINRFKSGSTKRRSPSDSYTDVRWYIGAKDKLPRKVEQITDAGLVKITLLFQFGAINMVEPSQSDLDIARPDGYKFVSTMPKPKQEQPNLKHQIPPAPTEIAPTTTTSSTPRTQPVQPKAPRVRRAPTYSFSTNDGSTINNTSQNGRVTLLYFWGSWCVPCKSESPLVSQIASDFADKDVDVFGLAIREADPIKAASDFAEAGYAHSLSLDADALVTPFKARVFPTIVVINKVGVIVYQKSLSKEMDPDQLAEGARSAVEEALK